ncbi:MAG: hypothetical protein EOO04_33595 [Chitinophagaceae bacterium]|nr:MAG: hypothetical protein EOO04_33595 [Chitinophagaceae bacterium]
MKIIFWISAIITFLFDYYLVVGFINVYYKNYNGGPESSSGSIIYPMIGGIVVLLAGLILYFIGYIKVAALILGIPVGLVVVYMLFMLLIPLLAGGRWN